MKLSTNVLSFSVSPVAITTLMFEHSVGGGRQPLIAAGANQIQHNIIGERVLGLPKG